MALLKEATLDEGQLRSFIDGLKSPVHLTQGPPGTGKSYLGVVMVRALMIVRKFWVKVDESVGTPPILVLSYKNHAIDEFLLDLIKADSRLGRGTGLIRIGGGASLDQRLVAFSEKTLGRQDWEARGGRLKGRPKGTRYSRCLSLSLEVFGFQDVWVLGISRV